MKIPACIILCLLIISKIYSQEWIKYYGDGQNANPTDCVESYDHGYLLAGSVNSIKYGWIIKTDINGNKLWDIKIGDGINQSGISDIEVTNDNGIIACGSTSIYNVPYTAPFIIKLNACGQKEWCKVMVYDNSGAAAISVKQASDGGYVLFSTFNGDNPENRLHLFKFDSGGELFWHKIYNRDSIVFSEIPRSLYVDSTNFLMTGFCYYPNWMKPYYIQTDTAGNEIWRLAYSQHTGLGHVGDAWFSTRDRNGNYYSVGYRGGSAELLKFSTNGYEMMAVDLNPTAIAGAARNILFYDDLTLVMDPSWKDINGINYNAIVKSDTLGNFYSTKYLPDPSTSGVSRIIKSYDGKLFVLYANFINGNERFEAFKFNSNLEYDSTYIRPFTYDSLCADTINSQILPLDCDVLVGLDEPFNNSALNSLKIFPNPAINSITVEMPDYLLIESGNINLKSSTVYYKWKSIILEIFDPSGKKIFQNDIERRQKKCEIDVSNWKRGLYIINLSFNHKEVTSGKFLLK